MEFFQYAHPVNSSCRYTIAGYNCHSRFYFSHGQQGVLLTPITAVTGHHQIAPRSRVMPANLSPPEGIQQVLMGNGKIYPGRSGGAENIPDPSVTAKALRFYRHTDSPYQSRRCCLKNNGPVSRRLAFESADPAPFPAWPQKNT